MNPCTCAPPGRPIVGGPSMHATFCPQYQRNPFPDPHDFAGTRGRYQTGGRRSGKSAPQCPMCFRPIDQPNPDCIMRMVHAASGESASAHPEPPAEPAREVGDLYTAPEGHEVLVWSVSTPLTAFPVRTAAEPAGEMFVPSEWLVRSPAADLRRFENMARAYMDAGGRLSRLDDFARDGYSLAWRRDPVTVTRVLWERPDRNGDLHPHDPGLHPVTRPGTLIVRAKDAPH